MDETFMQLLMTRAPLADVSRLSAETPLGAAGLGLDSITLAEIILDCGEQFGVEPPISLLAEERLTVGRVIEHLRHLLA